MKKIHRGNINMLDFHKKIIVAPHGNIYKLNFHKKIIFCSSHQYMYDELPQKIHVAPRENINVGPS